MKLLAIAAVFVLVVLGGCASQPTACALVDSTNAHANGRIHLLTT